MSIHIKKSHQGRLHRALDVPAGKKISMAKLHAAAHSQSARVRKEANFAMNARKWSHK